MELVDQFNRSMSVGIFVYSARRLAAAYNVSETLNHYDFSVIDCETRR